MAKDTAAAPAMQETLMSRIKDNLPLVIVGTFSLIYLHYSQAAWCLL